MKNKNSSREYLKKLESEERNKKVKLIGGIAVLIIALIATGIYFLPTFGLSKAEESEKFQSFFVANLSESQVKKVLSEANSSILVRYDDTDEMDTLRTYDDYLNKVLPKIDQASFETDSLISDSTDIDFFGSDDEESNSGSSTDNSDVSNPQYGFNIRGLRNTGNEIRFNIVNYDSDMTYTLDYGDGKREKVSNTSRHTFLSSGVYNVTLLVEGEGIVRQVYASATLNVADVETASTKQNTLSETQTEEALASTSAQATVTTPADQAQEVKEAALVEKKIAPKEEEKKVVAKAKPILKEKKNIDKPKDKRISTNGPVMVPDFPPSFQGGKAARNKFVRKNLRHPNVDPTQKKEGRVVVQFVVDKSGKVQSPRIIRSLGTVYDKEVLRVLSLMPKWRAAKVEGQNVSAYSQLSVSFRLVD